MRKNKQPEDWERMLYGDLENRTAEGQPKFVYEVRYEYPCQIVNGYGAVTGSWTEKVKIFVEATNKGEAIKHCDKLKRDLEIAKGWLSEERINGIEILVRKVGSVSD